MSLTVTSGYSWTSGEVVTATKMNLGNAQTIADGQTYTFGAGAAATPSLNFTGATTTGLYLGSSAIGFSAGGVSLGTWAAAALTVIGPSQGQIDIKKTGLTAFSFYSDTAGVLGLYSSGTVGLVTSTGLNACNIGRTTPALLTHSGMKYQTADVTVSASTTLTDLTGLSVSLLATTTYSFCICLMGNTSGTGGFKIAVTASGGLTSTYLFLGAQYGYSPAANGPSGVAFLSSTGNALGTGLGSDTAGACNTTAVFYGTITTGVAGTLTVQAAQNTASGACTFRKGSFIEIKPY